MKSGIIFPSYSAEVTWTGVVGGWEANYPLANIASLNRPSQVARANGVGTSRTISGLFPAPRAVQALAIVGHNYLSGINTIRLYGFSGVGSDPVADAATMVYDSGSIPWLPAGAVGSDVYRMIRPLVLPAPILMRSFRLVMANSQPGLALQISSIEIGGFWDWAVSPARSMGVQDNASVIPLIGGGDHDPGIYRPRIYSGAVDLMAMGVTGANGLDFQKQLDIQGPFVFAEDYDDPSTWARTCLLVRNEKLSPMVGRLYRHDAFPISLVEHMR